MAASLSIIVAKDGNGAIIIGGLQALDLSGAGTGPWSLANILVDGVSGANRASVTAANALKVDGSAVTQPVSGTVAVSGVSGTVTVAGTVTANAGTNMSTAALALETGGNLATLAGAVTASVLQANIKQIGATAIVTGGVAGSQGVGGLAAAGTAVAGNPLLVGGSDGTNARALVTDTSGHLIVEPGNTQNTTAWLVTGQSGQFPVLQATASNLNATVVGTGTFAVQAAQSGNWTARVVGNGGGVFDFAGQNATSPANAILTGGQFNTSPTTLTSGNVSPLQLDNAGNLLANIKTGSIKIFDGTNTAAVKAASTAPSATDPALVVAISPNSVNTNGSALSINSAPVVIASDQVAVAVKGTRASRLRQSTTITSSTSATTIVIAGGSGVLLDLYGLILDNDSSSNCEVTISDGTFSFAISVPANDTRGLMLDTASAINATTANTAWTATCGTSVASMKITALTVNQA